MKFLSLTMTGLIVSTHFFLLASSSAYSVEDTKIQTLAALYQHKDRLIGKTVHTQGKVVKVNNKIMGRNFVHIQDGTGDAANGSNDLVITSLDTALVGDQVSVSGKVMVKRDFGYGYTFALLIEEASITQNK